MKGHYEIETRSSEETVMRQILKQIAGMPYMSKIFQFDFAINLYLERSYPGATLMEVVDLALVAWGTG